jgi:hypothetical protein
MAAFSTDADISIATSGNSREARLQAAASAIAMICQEIGPAAALVLLNASIDAVSDQFRASQERR